MKYNILISLSLLFGLLMSSCAVDEPVAVDNVKEDVSIDLSNCEHFSLTINTPEQDMKTRAVELPEDGTPVRVIGEDGLWSFPRKINKVWYCLYHNGRTLYNSEKEGVPQAVLIKDEDNSYTFYLDLVFPAGTTTEMLKDYSICLYAANDNDNVLINKNIDYDFDGVILGFGGRYFFVNPYYINRYDEDLGYYLQYDSFILPETKLSEIFNNQYNGHILLHRPFTQTNVLISEFADVDFMKIYGTKNMCFNIKTTVENIQVGGTVSEEYIYTTSINDGQMLLYNSSTDDLLNHILNFSTKYSESNVIDFKGNKYYLLMSHLSLGYSLDEYSSFYDVRERRFVYNIECNGDKLTTRHTFQVTENNPFKQNHRFIIYNPPTSSSNVFSTDFNVDVSIMPGFDGDVKQNLH